MSEHVIGIFERNRTVINYLEWANECLKYQDIKSALSYIDTGMYYFIESINIMLTMESYCNSLFEISTLNKVLSEYLKAQEMKNYIGVMNILTKKILPLIYNIQEHIMLEDINFMENYKKEWDIIDLEKTNKELFKLLSINSMNQTGIQNNFTCACSNSGIITANIKIDDNLISLHSNLSPFLEAFNIVNTWNDKNKSKYIVYGLGLGYHVALMLSFHSELSIELYDNNLDIMKLANRYGDYNIFTQFPNLDIIYDPELSKLELSLQNMCENTKFVVYYPALNYIEKKECYDKLMELIKVYSID